MSREAAATDFDLWLGEEYASGAAAGFTALVLLVRIKRADVRAVSSTYFHVVGTEAGWGDVAALFGGSGKRWDAAALFPMRDLLDGGPLDETSARIHLLERATAVDEDRLAINEGHFFDAWGRRMKVEETSP